MTDTTVKKAIITGASTGIGAVYARMLAARGYDLITVARNGDRLTANAAEITRETGRAVEIMVADLSDINAINALAQRITDDASIAFVVNNAGVSPQGDILQTTPENAEALITLNITAPTLLSIAAAKAFVARGTGSVVNISSVTTFAPEMFDGTYSGSKNYLINLSTSLAGRTKDSGVRFQVVLPGPTDTDMWARGNVPESIVPRSHIMNPQDLVAAALAGLDKGEVITLPTVHDEQAWANFETARKAMWPHMAAGQPAARYR